MFVAVCNRPAFNPLVVDALDFKVRRSKRIGISFTPWKYWATTFHVPTVLCTADPGLRHGIVIHTPQTRAAVIGVLEGDARCHVRRRDQGLKSQISLRRTAARQFASATSAAFDISTDPFARLES